MSIKGGIHDVILKAVPEKDVYERDAFYRVQPLSTFPIQLESAQQFGLIQKDKNDKYHLGPNLEYELPQVTYSSTTVPTKTNDRYHWLGDHYLGIIPHDFRKDSFRDQKFAYRVI